MCAGIKMRFAYENARPDLSWDRDLVTLIKKKDERLKSRLREKN